MAEFYIDELTDNQYAVLAAAIDRGKTLTPGKASAMDVIARMALAAEDSPRGEPIGAYRDPKAPDQYLTEVPRFLYDTAPDTKQQGEQ